MLGDNPGLPSSGEVSGGHRGSPEHPGRRRPLIAGAVIATYALCAWAIALPLGLAPRSRMPTCACADVAQGVWWLAVAAHAPFALHTSAIDVPSGVSLLDNASFPLLGALLAPLTLALGPVASLVILLRLAFLTSAASAYLVLRRIGGGQLGPAVGGAVYAFFPYMTHQGASHVFLVFGPLPPVMLAILYCRLAPRGGEPAPVWVTGPALGLLGAAQFFVDSEVLVLTVVVAASVLAILAVREVLTGGPRARPLGSSGRLGRSRRLGRLARLTQPTRRLASLLSLSACVAVPILAVPVWEALTGPGRLVGSTQPTVEAVGVAGSFLPGDRGIVAGAWSPWRVAAGQYLGHSSYVGPVLALVCVVVAARGWKGDPFVRTATALVAAAWVLQLGGHLTLTVRPTAVPLPFELLAHLPVFEDIIPSRFSQFVGLGVGALVAVAVDCILAELTTSWRELHPPTPREASGSSSPARSSRAMGRLGRALAAGAVVVVGIALAAPDQSYGAHGVGPAKAFEAERTTSTSQGTGPSGLLPRGAVVLAYPVPAFPDDQAMLWQAVDGLHFRLVGGYAIRPGPGRRTDRLPLLPEPEALPRALVDAYSDPSALRPGAPQTAAAARALPAFVRRNRVRAVVVEQGVAGSGRVDDLMRSVLGPPLYRRDALELWLTVPPAAGRWPGLG